MTDFVVSKFKDLSESDWLSLEKVSQLTGWTIAKVRKLHLRGRFERIRYEQGARCRGGKKPLIHKSDPLISSFTGQQSLINRDSVMETLNNTNPELQYTAAEMASTKTQRDIGILREAKCVPPNTRIDDWYGVVAKQFGVSKATVYRKISESQNKVFKPVEGDHSVYHPIKSSKFDDEAVSWAISRYLNNTRVSIKTIYKELKVQAREKCWEIGSLPSLYRIIQKIPVPMTVYAAGGRRAVESHIMPKLKRDLSAYHVMECIVGDQHLFDYLVLDDDGTVFTPQMYAWMDQRSRYWVGAFPSPGSYSSIDIGLSLKQACQFGIPKSIYTDNGKPELSKYITGLQAQLSGLNIDWMDDEDTLVNEDSMMRHIKARPRNPRAKIIESHFYHGMESLLMQRDLPGYSKRAFNDFENEQRQKQIKDLKSSGQLLHYKEFYSEVLSVINEANQRLLTTENIVPEQYFFEHLPEAPILRFDEDTLNFLFLPSTRRRVKSSTVQITINGWGKCTYYARELSSFTGKEVEIRYNPYDAEKIYALNPVSHELIGVPTLERQINPKDKEQVSDKLRRYSSLASFWVEQTQKYLKKAQRSYPIQLSPYTGVAHQAIELDKEKYIHASYSEVGEKLINLYERNVAQSF